MRHFISTARESLSCIPENSVPMDPHKNEKVFHLSLSGLCQDDCYKMLIWSHLKIPSPSEQSSKSSPAGRIHSHLICVHLSSHCPGYLSVTSASFQLSCACGSELKLSPTGPQHKPDPKPLSSQISCCRAPLPLPKSLSFSCPEAALPEGLGSCPLPPWLGPDAPGPQRHVHCHWPHPFQNLFLRPFKPWPTHLSLPALPKVSLPFSLSRPFHPQPKITFPRKRSAGQAFWQDSQDVRVEVDLRNDLVQGLRNTCLQTADGPAAKE